MSPPPSDRVDVDPFAILGLEPRFDLDPAAVRGAYRARAAALHPDLAADPAARVSLARASAGLAEAQRVLLDPILRGEAVLAALGGAVSAGPPSGEFLVEMMELRETIDGAAGDRARLEAIRIEIDDRLGQSRDRLATTLAELAGLPGHGRSGGLRIAAETLGALRYLERLRAAVDGALAATDDGGRGS